MPDSEEEDILFLQIAVLMRSKKLKVKNRKYWFREIFRK